VLIFLILGSTILCVVVVLLLHLMVGIGIKWTFVGVTLVLSLLTTIVQHLNLFYLLIIPSLLVAIMLCKTICPR
jgi:hypothetical protein